MTLPSPVLTEPMLQGAVPRSAYKRKALVLLSLLVGMGMAVLLRIHQNGQHVDKSAVNMAAQYMQPVKARNFMPMLRVSQPMLPSRFHQSLPSAKSLQFIQPSQIWQYLQPKLQPLRADVAESDTAQGYGDGANEQTGVLMRWNYERGFGFIAPEEGGEDLFCHVRALVDGEGSVEEGNKVNFVTQYNDRQGKYEATEVRLAPGGEGDFRGEMAGAGEGAGEPGTGVLLRYMADRGFGFIEPEGGGENLFCHVSAFVDGEGSVQEGNKVTYVAVYNSRKGNTEASEVRVAPGGEGDHRTAPSGGGGGGGGGGAMPEKRIAPDGTGSYTKEDFVEYYGGTAEWDAAEVDNPITGEPETGVLMRWMAERGFGFIKPEGGGEDVFCHVRALVNGDGSVAEGNKVVFVRKYNDRQGKFEATDVEVAPDGEGDFRAALTGPPPDLPAPESGTGVLMRWMPDRGFGFIKPSEGGEDLFTHVSSLVDGDGSVQEGNKVTFVPQWNDRKGKYDAGEVRLAEGGEGDFRDEVGIPPPDQPLEAGNGIMMRWMSDRGFGFIQPEGGGDNVFCHVSALADGEGSVQEGNLVTFNPQWNRAKGNYEATDVRLAPGGEGEHRPEMLEGGVAVAGAVPDEEKRVAPDGTGSYTKQEFVDHYGGTAEWDASPVDPAFPGPAAGEGSPAASDESA
eukprot:gnl/TRDRNA2_/TRDRNA2_186387_c0_seq1.p1 gnl/TRDRNA2_/TRDRNA2_186387_c0~~gnl/TRDRNA2_/TRDRNA2_186387_c0_seq1.p1  ORF type:complete len:679 (+),score=148.87 gnl/TRDRNA2_/TRDRNA2_186387_c0_seq1:65-2101(+)